jgi:sister-chromatid-cohesion protein PDS5
MEKVTKPDISCRDSFDATNMILKKMGSPIMTNLYYNTIKQLLERISSVMIDREAIQILVKLVQEALNGGDIVEELGLNPETAGERGLRLLFVLSFVFPSHFVYPDVIHELLSMMGNERDCVAPLVLSILSFVGKHKPISEQFPQLQELLCKICLQFVKLGTKKQAKQAVKCMFLNTVTENQDVVFAAILDAIKENLNGAKNRNYLTAIVALGHLAFYLPDKFPVQVKNLVSRKIVKELVMKDVTAARGGTEEWCSEEELCLETQCKMEGMKVRHRTYRRTANSEPWS